MNLKAVSYLPLGLIFLFASYSGASAPIQGSGSNVNTIDSIAEAQYREELGQDFSSLFDESDDSLKNVDTVFAWNNSKINSGRFDYKALGPQDTIKIALIDSAQKKFYVHPIAGRITSPFGPRRYLWHYGTDVKLNIGDTLSSAFDGIVRVIQYDRRGYGNVVVVRHNNGLETLYGHMQKVTVSLNQKVKAGDVVGLGGNTGRSTGSHLHFEIRYFGEPFSPAYIIDFENGLLKSDTLVLTKDNFEYLTELRKTVYHTVRAGDNVGAIAKRYRTTVGKICALNGISSKTMLRVGRRLMVRGGKEVASKQEEVVNKQEAAAVQQGDVTVQQAEVADKQEESVAQQEQATPESL